MRTKERYTVRIVQTGGQCSTETIAKLEDFINIECHAILPVALIPETEEDMELLEWGYWKEFDETIWNIISEFFNGQVPSSLMIEIV